MIDEPMIEAAIYAFDPGDVAESMQGRVRTVERWDCPCGCGGYVLYGVGPSTVDANVDVLWFVVPCTYYPDVQGFVTGVETVEELDTIVQSFATRRGIRDGRLVSAWLREGLREKLEAAMRMT